MKLSWSHKLFLKINATVGKNKTRDRLMVFGANWLIVVMVGVVVLYGVVRWSVGDTIWLLWYLNIFLFVFFWAEVISYLFGLLFRRPRPVVEFPESMQLIKTMTTWKAFPSDHAITAFLLSGTLFFILPRSLLLIVPMYIAAIGVSVSRVYAGVHYPRDIVGGFIIAHLMLWLVPWFLFDTVESIFHLW